MYMHYFHIQSFHHILVTPLHRKKSHTRWYVFWFHRPNLASSWRIKSLFNFIPHVGKPSCKIKPILLDTMIQKACRFNPHVCHFMSHQKLSPTKGINNLTIVTFHDWFDADQFYHEFIVRYLTHALHDSMTN